MTRRIFRCLTLAMGLALPLSAAQVTKAFAEGSASADSKSATEAASGPDKPDETEAAAPINLPRIPPKFDQWTVSCINSGLCTASTLWRDQSVWVDLRIVRDWEADAQPMLRITANAALNGEEPLKFSVNGKLVDEVKVSRLRESQTNITPPAGFRPLGGEGFWYPTGPATQTLIEAMMSSDILTVDLPIDDKVVTLAVPLDGMKRALTWLDERQERNGTTNAILAKGDDEPRAAPHAMAILDPTTLPPAVRETWDANSVCSDIDPAIFTNLDAVSARMDEKTVLYLLPCGSPSAYNAPYVVLLSRAEGKTRQLHFARMSDQGPIATDLTYNLKWNPSTLELDSLYRGSGIGDCGVWDRWRWTGNGFALIEEASRSTCDGQETPLPKWPTTWPTVTESN